MGKSKYPTINGKKKCSNCFALLPTKEFAPKNNPRQTKGLRSVCNKCRYVIIMRKTVEKKLKLFPTLYVECSNEECEHIWRKRSFENCPRCGSSKEII